MDKKQKKGNEKRSVSEEKPKISVHELTEQTLKDGGLLAVMYFDMHGKSPEAIKNLLVEFLSRIADDPLTVWTYGEIEKPELYEGVYSTYAEVKVLVKNLRDLVNLVLKYAPLGIEIVKPHEKKLSIGELQTILMDLSTFSSNFTAMYLKKGLTEEKKREYARNMKIREEIGRKLIEKHRKEK